jgi:hypothetical protein
MESTPTLFHIILFLEMNKGSGLSGDPMKTLELRTASKNQSL